MALNGWRIPTLLLCALLAAALLPPAAAESVRLRFAPEPDSHFDITERVERVTTVPERDDVEDVRERKYRVQVKRTDTGYANTATVLSLVLTRNGHPVSSPVYASMAELELTYQLDGDGNLVGITGYEKLPAAMREKLPQELAQTMTRLLSYDSLRSQDLETHRLTYGQLPGASFEVGSAGPAARLHALPYGGAIPLYSVDRLQRSTSNGMVQLRLERTYNSDAAALADQFEDIDADDFAAPAGNMVAVLPRNHASAAVSGTEATEFDQSGLLIKRQTTTLEYRLALRQGTEDPVPFTIREVRTFDAAPYVPPPPAPAPAPTP